MPGPACPGAYSNCTGDLIRDCAGFMEDQQDTIASVIESSKCFRICFIPRDHVAAPGAFVLAGAGSDGACTEAVPALR